MLHATSFCALFSVFALLSGVDFRCFARIYAYFFRMISVEAAHLLGVCQLAFICIVI